MTNTHTFAGRRFRVRNLAGVPRDTLGKVLETNRTVYIPIRGDTLDELDTILHESIHACLPVLDEHAVAAATMSTARLLWKLGWRRDE